MLPQSFFDWWFTPWTYATGTPSAFALGDDLLARRDGYKLWCKDAEVEADFPPHFDPGWHIAAVTSSTELLASARLFGGLIAVRQNDQPVLDQLSAGDRKWCVSIAATQPLLGCTEVRYASDDSIEVRGLLELARRLEKNFSGVWSRLRLLLPPDHAARVGRLLQEPLAAGNRTESAATRALRCWRLCAARAASGGTECDADVTGDTQSAFSQLDEVTPQ